MNRKQFAAVTLLSLMLVFSTSGLAKGGDPQQGSLTMHLVLVTPEYDGEHAIAHSLQTEFAKIGITLELDYRDSETYDTTIGTHGTHWNITWDEAPTLGWDLKIWEWWGMPTSTLWAPAMMTAAGAPPAGWQTMGYNNSKFDSLLLQQYEEFDPVERKKLALLMQSEWVHDGYGPVLYAPEFVQVVDKRFQTAWGTPGWEDAVWWYDPFLYTWNESAWGGSVPADPLVLHYADAGEWYVYNPIYMWTYVQDMTQCQTHSMLYCVSKYPNASLGEGFWVRPYLASADPVWADDYLTCNISLRNDVYWHNVTDIWTPGGPYVYENEQFTADDVVMTFDALLDPDVGAWSEGDYVNVLDDAVYPGGCEKLDDFTVRFHLQKPYNEFKDLLANEWGSFILPEHIFDGAGVPRSDWYGHWTNKEQPPPGTGPYEWVTHNTEEGWWKLQKVPNYPTGLNPYGYGEQVFDEIIGHQIVDPTAGWTELMNHNIHFGYGSWDATPTQLNAANATGEFWVFNSPIPAVRHLCFNLNHEILSNRYVRQAIAHAIDYPHIRDDILPLYGLAGHIQATWVWRSLEHLYPTPAEEALYNIGPYEYNIAKAQQYMNMWKYSLAENTGTLNPDPPPPYNADPDLVKLGPVGDADFSGIVELDDFDIWARYVGTYPDDWPWYSGQDIDPDFDNTGYVELPDFYRWREHFGEPYPFPGAR